MLNTNCKVLRFYIGESDCRLASYDLFAKSVNTDINWYKEESPLETVGIVALGSAANTDSVMQYVYHISAFI